jgi:hypothetical protein
LFNHLPDWKKCQEKKPPLQQFSFSFQVIFGSDKDQEIPVPQLQYRMYLEPYQVQDKKDFRRVVLPVPEIVLEIVSPVYEFSTVS